LIFLAGVNCRQRLIEFEFVAQRDAVRRSRGLRELSAEVRGCAPPDFAERLAGVGVPMVRSGWHCCVGGMRAWPARAGPSLDGVGEFGEGCREPIPRVNIDSEFVVAAAEVLDECVPGTDHPRRAKPFQAAHRSQLGL
jgi:hypothetical protein